MKLKGISTLEHHTEKLVFSLFFLLFLFVLVLQLGLLGGKDSTVRVGARDVPLNEAGKAISDLATQKLAQMNSDRVNDEIPSSLPNVDAMFIRALAGGSSALAQLPPLNRPQISGGSDGTNEPVGPVQLAPDVVFAAVEPPPPAKPLTRVHGCTIDPLVVAQIGPELAQHLPSAQPFDVRAVSVESKFDAAAFREHLSTPRGEAQPVPAQFWEGRSEILDVVWVRQTLGNEGEWNDEGVLPALPGRFSMRTDLNEGENDITKLQAVLDNERAFRGEIRRPGFYGYVSGESWTWPSFGMHEARDPHLQDQIDALLRRLSIIRNEIRRIEERLNRLGWVPPRSQWPEPGEDWHWPKIPRTWRAQFGGGGGGGTTERDVPDRDREGEARTALEERLAQERQKEADAVAALAELSVNDKGQNLDEVGQNEFSEALVSLSQEALERVTLWYHDLTAEPGATYRYQVRVRITNPFFGKENELPGDQQHLAKDLIVESNASDWSDPVTIQPEVVYFVLNAASATDGAIGSDARAAFELYEFYYGYWRRARVNVYPGDMLSGEARLPEDLRTWNLLRDAEAVAVGDETPLPDLRLISTLAMLLDVAAPLDDKDDAAQVFLGMADGNSIEVRLAGGDGTGLYDVLASSADAGIRAQLRRPGDAAPIGNAPPPADGPAPAGDDPFGPGDNGGQDGGDAPGGLPSRKSGF